MTKGHLCTGKLVRKRLYVHCMLTLKAPGTTISICWETPARGWSGKPLGLGRYWPLTSGQILGSERRLGVYSVQQAPTETKLSIGTVHSKLHSSFILEVHCRTEYSAYPRIGRVLSERIINPSQDGGLDPAFYGRHSLLNTDQGIRGFLSITNDMSVLNIDTYKLQDWTAEEFGGPDEASAISAAVQSLSSHSECTSDQRIE